VERDRLLDGTAARAGDALVGIGSSGLHSNGFSLVRRIVDEADLDLGEGYADLVGRLLGPETTPEDAMAPLSLGEVLLTPTLIYSKAILELRRRLDAVGAPLAGVAHVTGGGLPGNVPRILAEGLGACFHPATWTMPSIMRLLGALGSLSEPELRSTFNGGLGMVCVVPASGVATAISGLLADGYAAWRVGEVVAVGAGEARYSES
jgi:phosphoribosylformylglycinamidine cyclo-ligase